MSRCPPLVAWRCTHLRAGGLGWSRRHVAQRKVIMAKFEVFKDGKGEFRFRLKASNGQVIATGESYKTKAGVLNGIASIKRNAADAAIIDLST
jgi:uncharacterized protein YegP (UPF0339 family)